MTNEMMRTTKTHPTEHRAIGLLLAATIGIALPAALHAGHSSTQSSIDQGAQDRSGVERDPSPTRPRAVTIEALDEIRPGQEPLLREGSVLMQVRASLRHNPQRNEWQVLITEDEAENPAYRLTLHPNRYLREIEQVLDASKETEVLFELAGRVYVYRQNNYMLITTPPRIVSEQVHAANQAEQSELEDEAESVAEENMEPADRDTPRGAREIMEELDQETGGLARALPRNDEDGVLDAEQDGQLTYRNEPLAEGTSIVQRRGRISRDAGGRFQFIFDADASGLADPPMTLLPCLMLERLERFARRNDLRTPILISGQVFTYERRNYLLPTQFTQPRERTTLMP